MSDSKHDSFNISRNSFVYSGSDDRNMQSLTFLVKGEPKAKGRPNFKRVGVYVQTYTPKDTEKAEKMVSLTASAQAVAKGWTIAKRHEPVSVEVLFGMQIPKSWSKKKKAEYEQRACCKNVDLDNMIKLICDGINQSGAIWHDDAQVTEIHAAKYWTENPASLVTITKI